jgi:hypothetical protein
MDIFDHNNPRHMEILREELVRAKQIMEDVENNNTYDPDTMLAINDKWVGRPLYRGLNHMMKEDPRYNHLLARFLREVNKVTMEDLTVSEIDRFFTLFTKFRAKINPESQHNWGTTNSTSLDADSYKAGRGRGGWQGD